tara:strand:+ start:284 stop:1234 length:951 start_codon:yes stop_codon:yes gene_type:complete
VLCQLAHQFPPFIEHFLERSRPLRRRFREETVTDLLIGSLIAAGGRRISVEFPNEPVTGADMELNFVNPDDNTFFGILIQAKQSYGDGNIWTRHGYKQLLHTVGRGPKLQAVALCDAARAQSATYPLYIFYHPKSTSDLARGAGFPAVTGASLADGYFIERLVIGATSQTLRTRNKCLKTIAPLLFRLTELFCPPTILAIGPQALLSGDFDVPIAMGREEGRPISGIYIPPTPAAIRERIVASREAMVKTGDMAFAVLPDVPEVADRIPAEVQAVIERRRDGGLEEGGLPRWRITFVSSSPRDIGAELDRMRQRLG